MEYTIISTTSEIGAHYGHHKNEKTLRKKGFRAMTWNSKPILLDIHFVRCHIEIQHHNGFRMIFEFGASANSKDRMVMVGNHPITAFSTK